MKDEEDGEEEEEEDVKKRIRERGVNLLEILRPLLNFFLLYSNL